MRALNQRISEATGHRWTLVDVPDAAASMMAGLFGWLPGAPMTWDQWLMLQHDNVVSPGAKGLKELGVTPTPLAAVAEGWLTSYRRHGRFAVKSPYCARPAPPLPQLRSASVRERVCLHG